MTLTRPSAGKIFPTFRHVHGHLLLSRGSIVFIDNAALHLQARAQEIPLLVGARGSKLELVLGTPYFDDPQPPVLPIAQLQQIEKPGLGSAIPLHSAVRARETPIVGAPAEYFSRRGL